MQNLNNLYRLIALYLQGVELQGTIRYDQGKMWKWDDGWDVTNTYDMNDYLEEVKRNRAALNIKIRSVFINEKTLVYH